MSIDNGERTGFNASDQLTPEQVVSEQPEVLAEVYSSSELRSIANGIRDEADAMLEDIGKLERDLFDKKTARRALHFKWQNYLQAAELAQSEESAE